MLVVTRSRDQHLMIGDNVVVTVIEIRGDKVRLGIELPREMPVHRTEVWEAIQRQDFSDMLRSKQPSDEERAFLDEIAANPRSKTACLVYADWLDESGDPRGEFIRVEWELRSTNFGHPKRPVLMARRRALIQELKDHVSR